MLFLLNWPQFSHRIAKLTNSRLALSASHCRPLRRAAKITQRGENGWDVPSGIPEFYKGVIFQVHR